MPYCSSGRYYTVEPGDTFWMIAQKTKTTVSDIINVNPGVNPNYLQVGQVICLPPIVPYGKTPECSTGVYWEVVSGDTIYNIAKRLGVKVDEILALNPYINPQSLQVGQIICLPIPK